MINWGEYPQSAVMYSFVTLLITPFIHLIIVFIKKKIIKWWINRQNEQIKETVIINHRQSFVNPTDSALVAISPKRAQSYINRNLDRGKGKSGSVADDIRQTSIEILHSPPRVISQVYLD